MKLTGGNEKNNIKEFKMIPFEYNGKFMIEIKIDNNPCLLCHHGSPYIFDTESEAYKFIEEN